MSRILKLALCGEVDNVEEKLEPVERGSENTDTIKMTGPLSEVYTKALQVVYAKTEKESGLVAAIESQANDAIMQLAIRQALSIKRDIVLNDNLNIVEQNEVLPTESVYVHSRTGSDFNADTLTPVANELATNINSDTNNRTVLIVEGGDSGQTEFNTLVEETGDLTVRAATENLCKSMGVELYYSFESFVKSLQKK